MPHPPLWPNTALIHDPASGRSTSMALSAVSAAASSAGTKPSAGPAVEGPCPPLLPAPPATNCDRLRAFSAVPRASCVLLATSLHAVQLK